MTGSILQLQRQHSTITTTGHSNMEKIHRPKLRRCSSADDHNSVELNPDEHHRKAFVFKREPTTSDVDSGTEEIEQQQLEHVFAAATINDNEDEVSVQSFGPNPDEGFSECEREEDDQIVKVNLDLQLAKNIADELKKEFCPDTSYAFHAEFARLISFPLSLQRQVRYYLFAEDEIDPNMFFNINFAFRKVDNAKAQFKCANSSCQHAWTSMRARISFLMSDPQYGDGYIIMKILGQNCQLCGNNADALWYIDEVCRVMRNLAQTVFETSFPDMLNSVYFEVTQPVQKVLKPTRHINHDPTQRKGKMFSPHNRNFCEACRLGLCFA